jgi:large subunit ribosomal protein L10
VGFSLEREGDRLLEGLVAASWVRRMAFCEAGRRVFVRSRPLSLNRNEKEAVIADVSTQVARSQTLALAEYRGLTVEHLNKLRREARDKGVYLHVLKNTLARRAVVGTPFEVAAESMSGPLIYSFSEDAVAAAKVLADFAKGNDKLVVKGGAYAGKVLDANAVKALAAIPSREVLIAQVAGLLKSPIQRLAGVLAALAEKRGEPAAGESSPAAPTEAPAAA